ncbi:hypothetical protein FRC03_007562 [Tulasnella sp. 419]|nr:hypothetical protein FRC03_007562 [Tulasnella sp. 419]
MAQFDNPYIAPVAISLALIYAISRLSKIGSRERHLPPGPPTLPLIGNLSILPLKDAYIKYAEWAKIYGDVYSLKIGPETLIVISSLEAMDEILEKNGAITADRGKFAPVLRFAPSGQIAFTPYGPQWRKMRKAAVEVLKSSTRKRNLPIQMAEISQMLFDMNEDPICSITSIDQRCRRSSLLLEGFVYPVLIQLCEPLGPIHGKQSIESASQATLHRLISSQFSTTSQTNMLVTGKLNVPPSGRRFGG